jgi:hypothetical protein
MVKKWPLSKWMYNNAEREDVLKVMFGKQPESAFVYLSE